MVLISPTSSGMVTPRRRSNSIPRSTMSIESNSNLEILEYHVYNALGEDVTPD